MEYVMDLGAPATARGRRWETWIGSQIPSQLLPVDEAIVREAAHARRVALLFATESSESGRLGIFVATGHLAKEILDLMHGSEPAIILRTEPKNLEPEPGHEDEDYGGHDITENS